MFSPNTTELNRNLICGILEVGEVNTPEKYLGVPMMVGKNKREEFNFLTGRIEQKLQEWKN